jgi:hypothetical protein
MAGIQLVSEFRYTVRTKGPLKSTKGSPLGERLYWSVVSAEIEGDRIRAKLAAPGSDWLESSSDGYWRPNVRMPLVTEDGETILCHYTGLVEQTKQFLTAAEGDRPTDWDDQYMRLVMHFDAGTERYRWLNTNIFIARGRLLGANHIEYEAFRVA